MTLKFDGWPGKTIGHLFYATLSFFASRSHWWIKRLIWVKIDDFFISRVTLQFDGWPWKIIGHLFHATSSFVHHFVAIVEFKLELQSGNAQFGSNSTIFRAVWPCNLTDDLGKNNRAHLPCYFKLCASFRSHWWIQTGVTVRKRPIWVKSDDFFYLCDLDLWPLTLTFCMDVIFRMDVTFVITPENFVMIRWWEHSQKGCDGRTERQADGDWTIHRAAWSQLKLRKDAP